MGRTEPEHIVLRNGGGFACLRCGGNYEMALPVPVAIYSAASKAFQKQHRGCSKPGAPRCEFCLELGHESEEHVALKVKTPRDWIGCGDTGLSSIAIWAHFTGAARGMDAPLDPSDFGRCHRLLAKFPEWRARIGEMAGYRPWKRLAPRWDELEALFLEEKPSGSAPKLYALMKELRGDA